MTNKQQPPKQENSILDEIQQPVISVRARTMPPGYLFLWGIAGLSLAFNVLIVLQLLQARRAAAQAVSDAIIVLDGLQDEVFDYTFELEQTLQLRTTIPINANIPVTIDEELDIDTTVNVPIDGPFGPLDFDVPIRTTIPVEFDVVVVIDQSFPVNTAVPIDLSVPVSIAVADTPLQDTLAQVIGRLEVLEAQLTSSPLTPAAP